MNHLFFFNKYVIETERLAKVDCNAHAHIQKEAFNVYNCCSPRMLPVHHPNDLPRHVGCRECRHSGVGQKIALHAAPADMTSTCLSPCGYAVVGYARRLKPSVFKSPPPRR